MNDSPTAGTGAMASRFDRLERIDWWDQALIGRSRILVIGAGALGNEVLKILALLGVGHVIIVDFDAIERSNLCRSVLFREGDNGEAKAAVAARSMREIYPGINVTPIVGNVLSDAGFGLFRWADAVIAAVDNREARVFINRACAEIGTPWFDGGLDVLNGLVRGFQPPQTACYECTLGQADWDLLNQRRSCTLLARFAQQSGGTPTTPAIASVIGGLVVQEAVKQLHGLEALLGRGVMIEGLAHSTYLVDYPIASNCPWHESPAAIRSAPDCTSDTPLADVVLQVAEDVGAIVAIDLSREIVETLACAHCGKVRPAFVPVDRLTQRDAVCGVCGAELIPRFVHSLAPDSPLLEKTASELGLPPWDVLWVRGRERNEGVELTGDRIRFAGGTGSLPIVSSGGE